MRTYSVIFLFVLLTAVLSGCFPFRLPVDYAYSLCTSIEGTVVDSATAQPLGGVSLRVYNSLWAYRHNSVKYADSTDSTGAYHSDQIEILYLCGPKKIKELKAKPPMRKTVEWTFVFEKAGYKTLELLAPVELVYCGSHPQPAAVPEVKIPLVYLVEDRVGPHAVPHE